MVHGVASGEDLQESMANFPFNDFLEEWISPFLAINTGLILWCPTKIAGLAGSSPQRSMVSRGSTDRFLLKFLET